jgi:hypothetical protein
VSRTQRAERQGEIRSRGRRCEAEAVSDTVVGDVDHHVDSIAIDYSNRNRAAGIVDRTDLRRRWVASGERNSHAQQNGAPV